MTEAMKVETLERLMSNLKPTPELDVLFSKGLVDGELPIEDMEKLREAGYVEKGKTEDYEFTKEGSRYAFKKLPEQAKVMGARVEERQRDERIEKERKQATELAQALVKQELLVIKDGKYHNTPKGWAGALRWFQMELKSTLEDRNAGYGWDTEICSRSGDFEGVSVSQPWKYHDNVLVVKNGFRNIKKQLVNSLSEEERELFGLPPVKVRKSVAEMKVRLLEVLTRYQDGSASDLVATAKSTRR